MADDFGMDMAEVMRVIDTAEVMLIRFALLEKRLLMDTRYDEQEGPLLAIVPRAGSVEGRLRYLKEMRPRFPLPQRILSFLWPRSVASMRALGLWERILDRIAQGSFPGTAERCEAIFAQLLEEEKAETLRALKGEGNYHSLWERPRTGE